MPCGIPILYPSGTGKASGHRGNLNDASYLLSINTRYTAPISSTNARIWFHPKWVPLNAIIVNTVNTTRVIHSCITFSWTKEYGPPLPSKPIRLAGIINTYSTRAMPQLISITAYRGQLLDTPLDWSLRCPYHARVINTLEIISRITVTIAGFITFSMYYFINEWICQIRVGRLPLRLPFLLKHAP